MMPSLLEFTGLQPEKKSVLDGENMIETILGKSTESRKAPIFYSRPPDRKNYYGIENLPDLAVRDGNWKLLCDYDGGRPELYQIVNDSGEKHNLAETYPDIVKKLTDKVVSWYQSMPVLEENTSKNKMVVTP